MSYTKVGSISLWEGDSENPKAPVLRGEVEVNGTKMSVSLWPFDGENTAKGPKFKGSVEARDNG